MYLAYVHCPAVLVVLAELKLDLDTCTEKTSLLPGIVN